MMIVVQGSEGPIGCVATEVTKVGRQHVNFRENLSDSTNLVVFPLQLLEIVLQYLIALFILLESIIEPGAEFFELQERYVSES
jgi:hypothetical protein